MPTRQRPPRFNNPRRPSLKRKPGRKRPPSPTCQALERPAHRPASTTPQNPRRTSAAPGDDGLGSFPGAAQWRAGAPKAGTDRAHRILHPAGAGRPAARAAARRRRRLARWANRERRAERPPPRLAVLGRAPATGPGPLSGRLGAPDPPRRSRPAAEEAVAFAERLAGLRGPGPAVRARGRRVVRPAAWPGGSPGRLCGLPLGGSAVGAK